MLEHEYSVLGGTNRAAIGRILSIVATAVASGVLAIVLVTLDAAKTFGWAPGIPPLVMWPLTAGVVYTALYWLFDAHVWKLPRLSALLNVPDLSGEWICKGQTLNQDKSAGYSWEARVTIVQSWDRLRVRLQTAQSTSNSIAAALIHDPAVGYRLLYNYKNEPRIGERDLAAHRGSAELTFFRDLQSAEGEYFNGHGRYTFGTMHLQRKDAV